MALRNLARPARDPRGRHLGPGPEGVCTRWPSCRKRFTWSEATAASSTLDFAERLTPEQRELRASLRDELEEICSRCEGVFLEEKPASFAVHYRNASEQVARTACDAVLAGPAAREAVQVRHGKQVVELLLIPTDKGSALRHIRRNVGATAVLFLGDDLTDEDAFAVLRGPDVSVKVGEGPTRAAHRLEDTREVARTLARARRDARGVGPGWLRGADRGAFAALGSAHGGAGDARRTHLLVLRAATGFAWPFLRVARRSTGRDLRRPAGRRVGSLGSGLPRRFDVARDSLAEHHRDRLPRLLGRPPQATGGTHRPDPDRRGHGPGGAGVRAPPGLRTRPDPVAGPLARPAGRRLDRADRAALAAGGLEDREGRKPRERARGRRPRAGAPGAGPALRHREPRGHGALGTRASRAHRHLLEELGRSARAARSRPGAVPAQRAHPQGPVPLSDGSDRRRGHDQPARGHRRRAQLGLSLLLAARRGSRRYHARAAGKPR